MRRRCRAAPANARRLTCDAGHGFSFNVVWRWGIKWFVIDDGRRNIVPINRNYRYSREWLRRLSFGACIL